MHYFSIYSQLIHLCCCGLSGHMSLRKNSLVMVLQDWISNFYGYTYLHFKVPGSNNTHLSYTREKRMFVLVFLRVRLKFGESHVTHYAKEKPKINFYRHVTPNSLWHLKFHQFFCKLTCHPYFDDRSSYHAYCFMLAGHQHSTSRFLTYSRVSENKTVYFMEFSEARGVLAPLLCTTILFTWNLLPDM